MEKKKIFFVIPDLDYYGGAERVVFNIISSLDLEKFEVTLVLFIRKGYFLQFLDPRVKIKILGISQIKFFLLKFLPFLTKEKPDIVFLGWGELSAFISPFIPFYRKTKFIARETNVVTQHVTRKEIRFFYRFYNNFQTIIAQSDDMKSDLIKNIGVKPEKIVKINNPVDFEDISKKSLEIPDNEYFNRTTCKKVIAVGNLSNRKGIDNLLKVFTYLKDENIELFILGTGKQEEEYKNFKYENGLEKVHFLGIKSNPYAFLSKADLFVLSSRYEGFPNVLLEAGACGTYSLANNCPGGISEIIQNKINGEISTIENHKNFAKKIVEVLNETHESEIIINSIKSRFSKEIILKKYEDLLLSL